MYPLLHVVTCLTRVDYGVCGSVDRVLASGFEGT